MRSRSSSSIACPSSVAALEKSPKKADSSGPSKRTAKTFEFWRQIPGNVENFFRVLEGTEGKGKRFRDACFAAKIPYTLMYSYVHRDAALKARYEAVLASKAQVLVEQALDDVDGAVDRETSAAAKVKAETKLKVAEKWDRERYGERVQIEKSIEVTFDPVVLGRAAELLRKKNVAAIESPRQMQSEMVRNSQTGKTTIFLKKMESDE